MIILQDILSQEIIQRLGWTLLHFIWQATAVVLILAILLRLLRKSSANLRYIIACFALALIVLLPLITIQLVPVSTPHPTIDVTPSPVPTVLPIVEMPAPETIVVAKPSQPESVSMVPSVTLKQRIADTFEPSLPYIVSGWLIGVFGLSIWHLGGWTQLQRLKRRMVKQVDSTLQSKLKVLSQKLKVKQTVQLMESALVQIPTVVGWLRPVILLPASALTGLNTEQLEAIIAHELAHIKRFDYLINILQTTVEILGFYHPAVWWISYKIRAERENCCDDMAVGISGDRVSYAGALASMEEIRTGHGKLTVAAGGGNLFKRICRLLGKDSTDSTGLSWVPAVTVILLIIASAIPTTLALTNKTEPEQVTSKTDRNKFLSITCTGRIVDSGGDAVNSAMVEAYETYFDKAGNLKLRLIGKSVTKDDGKFSFKTTPSVKKNRSDGGLIIAQKEGLAIGWTNWPIYDGNQKTKITLQEPTKLSGRVVDDKGNPVSNAEVRAVLFEDKTTQDGKVSWLPGIRPSDWLSVHTDSNGRFEFNNIPQNVTSDLLVTAPGFGTIYSREPDRIKKSYEWAEYKAGQTDIKITIAPEAGIEGRLVNEKTGKGMAGITLRVIPYFTPVFFERYLCTTKEDGSFSIGGLRTGNYVIMRADSRNLKVDVEVESGKIIRNVILKYPYDVRNIKSISNEMVTTKLNEQRSDIQVEDDIQNLPGDSEEKRENQIEKQRIVSAQKLKQLGLAVAMYADDNNDNLPESIQKLRPYIQDRQDFDWLCDNVEYVLKETTYKTNRRNIPVAYDKTLNKQQSGTNVLFLDGHVEFVTAQRLSELDLKRAEFMIEARFLAVTEDFLQNLNHNAASPDEAEELLKLKSELLAAVDGDNKLSFIPPERDINLLLKAIQAHKDSKILAEPQVICQEDKTAKITVSKKIPLLTGYTEPNSPSEKPKPKIDQVEEGINLSLKPSLTPNNNIYMQLELEIIQVLDFKELEFEGKTTYMPQKVETINQATQYTAKDGQTLLSGGHKIIKNKDVQAEEKDLLILVKAQRIDSSELDKTNQSDKLAVVEAPSSTSKEITPPIITKRKTERYKDDAQEKIKADETVTEIFELRYGDPIEIIELLKKFINGRLENGAIIEQGKEPIVLIPEPRRKWIIAKASAENIQQIGQWIKKLDTVKTIGMDPIDAAVYGQLETIVDLSDLSPGMPFSEVIEKLENSVEPPLQIQPIWKDLLENAEVEQATPAGMDPLPYIKLRKALEILLTSVSSTGLPKPTYVVDEGVILIGTASMLPPKMIPRVDDTSVLVESFADAAKASPENIKQIFQSKDKFDTDKTIGMDPIDAAVYGQLETIVDLSDLSPGMPFSEVIEKLENSVEPPLQIQPIWKDLLENAEVEQTTPAGMDPLPHIKLGKALEILLTSVSSTGLPKLTYVVDKGVILIGTVGMLPQKTWMEKFDTDKTIGMDPIDAAVYEQLETIVDLSDLSQGMSFSEVIDKLENSVEPPVQIQPIWKDLLENAEVEQATPAGMDPLPHIKLGKALEILLTSVSSTGLPKLTYVVDKGVILIGTAGMLPPRTLQPVTEQTDLIETTAQPSYQRQEKTPSAIQPHEMQILRQKYINNDSIVKFVTERITKKEAELIELRQQYTPSHPEIKIKVSLLQALKNALQERKKEVGEAFDDMMTKEIYQSNKEQIAKLLNELREPNLPPDSTVPLVSFTFVDYPLIDTLHDIATIANVTIIPDETISGAVTCKLKEVTVEKALDIVLAGTPYIWKKTPNYYLVSSRGIELPEITARIESAKKLSNLGKALLIYANDRNDKYPDSLHHLPEYTNLEEFKLVLENVEYLAHGKTPAEPPDMVIAYDKKLLAQGKGTNVLYNDCHVSFEGHERLKQFGISRHILIETEFWSVNEGFLKEVGLNENPENLSEAWRELLAATYPAGANGKPYGLIIDELHVNFLHRVISADHGSKALVTPRVITREDTTAEIGIMTEEYRYITGYNEPQDPSGEPQPKRDKVEIGTRIWLTPKLTDDNRNINLDLRLELTQLKGIIEGQYKDKYPIYKPIIDVASLNMPCTIPDGKSMLIGGLKITEYIKKESNALIGEMFKRGILRNDNMLLILVKPVINPQQKATKVLPGQEDSEKDIRRLAEQLDKKIKSPVD